MSVTISGTIIDTGVGVGAATFNVSDQYGQVQPSGPLSIGADGRYSVTVSLAAARNGTDKDGRRFTITIAASDLANNRATVVAFVLVPDDQR